MGVRVGSAMIYHPGMNSMPSFMKSGPGWQAGGIRDIALIKDHAFFRDTVDERRGVPVVSIATKVISPEGIDINMHNFHLIIVAYPLRFSGSKLRLKSIDPETTLYGVPDL